MWRTSLVMIAAVFNLCASAYAADKPKIITFSGIAPVALGMTVEEAERALGAKLTPRNISNADQIESCWYTKRADAQDGYIGYMVGDNRIIRIDSDAFFMRLPPEDPRWQTFIPPVSTEAGITFGATRDMVLKAYAADEVSIRPNPNGDDNDQYISVKSHGQTGILHFETRDGRVNDLRVGLDPAVYWYEGCL